MRGWKVVSSDRRSVFAHELGLAARRYPAGVEVRPAPEQGPLAVFDGRRAARSFARTNSAMAVHRQTALRVVRCEYIPIDGDDEATHPIPRGSPGSLWCTDFLFMDAEDRTKGRGYHNLEPYVLPSGTVLASSV